MCEELPDYELKIQDQSYQNRGKYLKGTDKKSNYPQSAQSWLFFALHLSLVYMIMSSTTYPWVSMLMYEGSESKPIQMYRRI